MDLLPTLTPTLLGLLCGAIGWFLKSRFEARRRDQEALRDERAKIYVDILTPFIRILTDLSESRKKEALEEVTSLDYRKLAFRLVLVGDDNVVSEWNDFWGSLFGEPDPEALILAFGDVLLAIRRGLGIQNTALSNKDMLRWMIKDIDTLKGVASEK